MNILKGIFGAMCTPFQENGEGIDLKKYYSHIDDLLEAGVHGLVLCSGTGEYAYLTDEEKQTLITEGVKHINGRCLTIAQTTALSTNAKTTSRKPRGLSPNTNNLTSCKEKTINH